MADKPRYRSAASVFYMLAFQFQSRRVNQEHGAVSSLAGSWRHASLSLVLTRFHSDVAGSLSRRYLAGVSAALRPLRNLSRMHGSPLLSRRYLVGAEAFGGADHVLRTPILRRIFVPITSLGILLGSQQTHACTAITKCQAITTAGAYCAPSNTTINMTAPGDCLAISAPNVALSADSLVINGPVFPAGGTAIHILATATHAVVNLTGNTNLGGSLATRPLTVGIQDDGSYAQFHIEGFVGADTNGAGGLGYGAYLKNVTGTTIQIAHGNDDSAIVGESGIGLWIYGGSHSVVVSDNSVFGDGPSGDIGGGGLAGIYIQSSSYNVLNHLRIGGDGINGVLIAGSASNTIYNNSVGLGGGVYGISVTANSPNNVIENNVLAVPDLDGGYSLFQGITSRTIGCNGDCWANNSAPANGFALTWNQPCIGQQQTLSNY